MKYLVVHTPENIFIGEFTKNAYDYKDKIIQAAKDDYNNMMKRNLKFKSEDWGADALWDNYLKNETLNKYKSFRRISK